MKKMFGYIRVSTAKQGEGVSLPEQKRAIEIYAERNRLDIVRWFEEKETAAKRGRPVFSEMLKLLRGGTAKGVIIHKIDRSARNLRDWADIGELIDGGTEIHFAHEALDLGARSGRLSADIQAVIAADYIRNLREETKKGMYGRLRQGIYPLPAPVGYLDTGRGKLKEIDPKMGPLIKKLYRLYATHRYGYRELSERMYTLGLRNKRGGKVTRGGIGNILHNKFYIGLMPIHVSGQIFEGKHQPLIEVDLFDQVQVIASGRKASSKARHNFVFRQRIRCGHCGGMLTGELQKGHVYYRCHRYGCSMTGIREDLVEDELLARFIAMEAVGVEINEIAAEIYGAKEISREQKQATIKSLELQLRQASERLDRLSDKFIDDQIDNLTFNKKKESLLLDMANLKGRIKCLNDDLRGISPNPRKNFELLKNLAGTYHKGNATKKQELLDMLASNPWTFLDSLEIPMKSPFQEVAKRRGVTGCCPHRDGFRADVARSGKKSPRPGIKHRTVDIRFVKAAESKEGQATER